MAEMERFANIGLGVGMMGETKVLTIETTQRVTPLTIHQAEEFITFFRDCVERAKELPDTRAELEKLVEGHGGPTLIEKDLYPSPEDTPVGKRPS